MTWAGVRPCDAMSAPVKPGQLNFGDRPVIGIYAIGIFLIVMGALNWYEFGRLD